MALDLKNHLFVTIETAIPSHPETAIPSFALLNGMKELTYEVDIFQIVRLHFLPFARLYFFVTSNPFFYVTSFGDCFSKKNFGVL